MSETLAEAMEDGGIVDCLVIGGGPAGLTAALYLARYHLAVLVLDAGDSRAALIPLSHNHAGYPEGITGTDLLARMGQQAMLYGAQILPARVDALMREDDGFVAVAGAQRWRARSVLLATGVINNRPAMPKTLHDDALARGLIRYCPICDGYEVTDKRVGVIGTGERGLREALFLRSYTADLALIAPDGAHELDAAQRGQLEEAGIVTVEGAAPAYAIAGGGITVAGQVYDSLYPALGSKIRSELAGPVGAEMAGDGCMVVDSHQRTSVAGLYAAGDVVLGLDQISHAMGEGGVAATTMRNDLAKRQSLFRAAPEAVKAAAH
ncbi:NAD(P)/FAD-dependent oxidoreductase [Sandarakinorhabdus sp. DWP1-3-1]|uniref:NAD(P)/FAD-dependent oxidoreductase n=1 Tax=Sandarakinorhabdus sp. DWP1-3-1 TaxID=2804627 RepID=UPI003CF25698